MSGYGWEEAQEPDALITVLNEITSELKLICKELEKRNCI